MVHTVKMDIPLYQQLARHLQSAISSGTLQPGSRLPSVRHLAAQHRVSISTALQVYRQLENWRLVEARPKSGYFVTVAADTKRSGPLKADTVDPIAVQDRVLSYNRIRRTCRIHFDVAIGPPALYPVRKLQLLGGQILRRQPNLVSSYGMNSTGYLPLREQVARSLLNAGCTVRPDDVLIANGCTEALNLALRATTQVGGTVAVESPVYFGLLEILASLGLRALEIPTSASHGMSLEALELVTRPDTAGPRVAAVVSIPNFHNPLGSLMPDSHKKRLVELLNARQIPLIEDDVYGELHFGGQRPFALKSWDTTGNVLLCGSASKVLAPNLRVGWIVAGRWQNRVEALKFTQSINTAELPQAMVAEFMASGGYDHHLRRLRQQIKIQTRQTAQAITHHFPPGTVVHIPSGGYLLWIGLPNEIDAWQVFEQAVQQGIGVTPGTLFTGSGRFKDYLRISCGNAFDAEAERAMAQLGRLVAAMQG
ncbi:PLP-dependent aminotransferase family protein [Parvibium lacunae]|uniref:PLP-dependent aminotransferase family protein n=1 Tax=Parvibium lacunae TaxID=1888893 RepID=A0A368L3B5_9BURK|nr:PLP-dependent aminotransferase family protein [Parvibium lacunae]RCS58086.1 PLP-dependent aminotransferase family protein [Parvibium lacunae]